MAAQPPKQLNQTEVPSEKKNPSIVTLEGPKALEILTWPNEILTKKAKEVEITPELLKLARNMLHTLEVSDHGIGLAAPQVGESVRLVVMNVRYPVIMFNPKIIATSQSKMDSQEGCLSFPDTFVTVRRWKWVKVEYTNENGTIIQRKFRELDGRCVQHELDHLDGITMMERRI